MIASINSTTELAMFVNILAAAIILIVYYFLRLFGLNPINVSVNAILALGFVSLFIWTCLKIKAIENRLGINNEL